MLPATPGVPYPEGPYMNRVRPLRTARHAIVEPKSSPDDFKPPQGLDSHSSRSGSAQTPEFSPYDEGYEPTSPYDEGYEPTSPVARDDEFDEPTSPAASDDSEDVAQDPRSARNDSRASRSRSPTPLSRPASRASSSARKTVGLQDDLDAANADMAAPTIELPPEAVAADLLQKHFRQVRYAISQTASQVSKLSKFVSEVKSYEVMSLLYEKSLKFPNALTAICDQDNTRFRDVAILWIEEMNFVLSGDFHNHRATEERQKFKEFLVNQSIPGDAGRDHVRRMTVPGFSRSTTDKVLEVLLRCRNLKHLTLGIRMDDVAHWIPTNNWDALQDNVANYATDVGIDRLYTSKIEELTFVKTPSESHLAKKQHPTVMDDWLLALAQHVKESTRDVHGPRVFVDMEDFLHGQAVEV